MIRYLSAPLVLAAALALAGCGSGPGTLTARGTLQAFANPLDGESAQTAYPDLTSGAQVVVRNSSGKVVGTGALTYSKKLSNAFNKVAASSISGTPSSLYSTWAEAFTFTVKVPGGLARYGIEAGSGHGVVWFTPAQMQKGPALTLGSMSG